MYYRSIEEAISAAHGCTHVLTTGSKWDCNPELKGMFAPVILSDGEYLCATNLSAHDGMCISEEEWVIALDLTQPQPTQAYDIVKPVALSQAATGRQIGGNHYKSLKIQPIEYIDANNLPYLEGNVIKYVTRHASKNGVQDIDKAIHYLELIKQMRYNGDTASAGKPEFPAVTAVEAATQYITHQPKAHHSDYKYFMKRQDRPFLTEATYLSLQVALLDSEDTNNA